ncbi:MAG: Gx transporter family protein [Clostridia bacterium]|nr:Gx transporter family protein [Clostridia bacterium]
MNKGRRFDAKRIALCGVLLSLMLVLGWVEHMIPINAAIPGIKLGLSNGVLIFAVYMLDVPTSFVLMAMKVLLSCAFLGTPASMMIYGFAGGVLSLTAMVLLSRVKGLHAVTVSMVGGVMHNVGQVAAAMIMLNTPNLLYYMAVLMVVGLGCGALTGVCASLVMKHMRHMRF